MRALLDDSDKRDSESGEARDKNGINLDVSQANAFLEKDTESD